MMAGVGKTAPARRPKKGVPSDRLTHPGSKPSSTVPSIGDRCMPLEITMVIETHRRTLQIAISLLSSMDAVLERNEAGGSDILDADDPADELVLKARAITDPLDLVRLAIQRVYQVHSDLDSDSLLRAARDAK